jgi:hypothetical protein
MTIHIHRELIIILTTLVYTESNGCFFKFHRIGVEESIVNALYRLRITDQLFKILRFKRVVRSQSALQRLL